MGKERGSSHNGGRELIDRYRIPDGAFRPNKFFFKLARILITN
jgi:hypothetical protein